MSAENQAAPAAPPAATEASLLDELLAATRQTERARAEDLLRALTDEALKGTVTWNRNVGQTIREGIKVLDAALSKQLAAVLHHPDLQKLEGSWCGLHHVVMNSETGSSLRIKVLNVNKRELFKDLTKAAEFDQSQTFKKLYENEFVLRAANPTAPWSATTNSATIPTTWNCCRACPTWRRPHSVRSSRRRRRRCSGSTSGPSCRGRATWKRSSRRPSTPSGGASAIRKTRASRAW
jgi:hypothetical protein